mmetsp:Transcript_15137/g.23388  ORF Transcript_15137/g.23388 Transcript_15137/m.23388 type:complete len:93 (+) Transcript_15137:842-1120(+)
MSKGGHFDEHKLYCRLEERRFRAMLDLMIKFRDWEEEKIKVQLMQGLSSGAQGVNVENEEGKDFGGLDPILFRPAEGELQSSQTIQQQNIRI